MRGSGERAITTLAKAVQCSRYFARRIITAVDEGKEDELLKRQKRRDAVSKEVIEEFHEFLEQPEISRNCPGQTKSVGYGKREPLYLLKASKEAIVEQFRSQQPVRYKTRVLMNLFPKNFCVPRSNHRSRNVCPLHAELHNVTNTPDIINVHFLAVRPSVRP